MRVASANEASFADSQRVRLPGRAWWQVWPSGSAHACQGRAAWEGRSEDRDHDGVSAAVCFNTRAGFRYRGAG